MVIIEELNKIGRDHISDTFVFQRSGLLYVAKSNNPSIAINCRKNTNEQVTVLNWFDDFWLYIEIHLVLNSVRRRAFPNVFFTLSLFQGTTENKVKTQLFRAEWDNYADDSNPHPQPHWHVYTKRDIEKIKHSFKELLDATEDDFRSYVETDSALVNIDDFHFAMNGQWSDKKSDIHKITAESHLTNWFAGILNNIKNQLVFLKNA